MLGIYLLLGSHTFTWRGRGARTAEPMDAVDGKREVVGLEAQGPLILPVSGRNLERFHEKDRDHKTPNKNAPA